MSYFRTAGLALILSLSAFGGPPTPAEAGPQAQVPSPKHADASQSPVRHTAEADIKLYEGDVTGDLPLEGITYTEAVKGYVTATSERRKEIENGPLSDEEKIKAIKKIDSEQEAFIGVMEFQRKRELEASKHPTDKGVKIPIAIAVCGGIETPGVELWRVKIGNQFHLCGFVAMTRSRDNDHLKSFVLGAGMLDGPLIKRLASEEKQPESETKLSVFFFIPTDDRPKKMSDLQTWYYGGGVQGTFPTNDRTRYNGGTLQIAGLIAGNPTAPDMALVKVSTGTSNQTNWFRVSGQGAYFLPFFATDGSRPQAPWLISQMMKIIGPSSDGKADEAKPADGVGAK